MCFKNLPIEFDEQGNATLKGGIADPYKYDRKEISREQLKKLMEQNGYVRPLDFDPVTRVAGALAFHSTVDLKERKVLEAVSMATLFRGYEVILKGRDPRDAIFISSRACGVCGGVHAVTSAYALGMVDFCESAIRATNPEIWERAVRTPSRYGDIHGFPTVGALMTGLNPLTGSVYLEVLEKTRTAREMYVVLGGKYPHPQTIVPGGVTTTLTRTALQDYF